MEAPREPKPLRMAGWMRRLRMRHLEVLLAIARHGSLTATAEALGVSQPAISQWLADVEAATGVRLFVRGRRLQPTVYLEPVLHHARWLVAESWRLEHELEAIGAGSMGTVRVGTMLVAGPALMPQTVLRLRRDTAGLRIEIVEDIAAGLWPRLERNEIDLIVGRLDERAYESGLSCEALLDDLHCVVAGVAHPLLRRAHPDWSDAAAYPWVLPPAGTQLRHAIDSTFASRGLPPPRSWLDSASLTTNQVILRETDCLGVLSGAAARHFAAMKAVAIVPLRLSTDIGPIGMAWMHRQPGPALQRMMQALREVANDLGANSPERQ